MSDHVSIGRGGAGNIGAIEQQNARVAEDLEASQGNAEAYLQPTSPTESVKLREPSYLGRGGSGNYGSHEDLDHWEKLNKAEGETFASLRKGGKPQSPTYGRGGAGNYASGAPAIESRHKTSHKMTEDEQKREKLKADVEKGVKDQLAMPQKARLPGGEPY